MIIIVIIEGLANGQGPEGEDPAVIVVIFFLLRPK